jgi:hypothetical protein
MLLTQHHTEGIDRDPTMGNIENKPIKGIKIKIIDVSYYIYVFK